ncbi:MAG: hypothetical protein WD269_00080 [Acidimicrobiia bacterium]
MTDVPHDSDFDQDAVAHHALIGLHGAAGVFGDLDPDSLPDFNSSSPGTAMRLVAEAPKGQIPDSARLAALHDLARAGFPHYDANESEYRLLASSVADEHGLQVEQLLSDLKESAGSGVPFATTASGQQLPHHTTAFIGQDVCSIRTVQVGGFTATWILSEFETDAPFDHLTEWVDPRNWPQFGPMLFKQMDLVGVRDPIDIKALGDEHWHGVFHEEVQLVTRVNTLLHCDYWRDGDQAAGMTYELDLSLDNELDVDRGFLSVNDVGPVRRVKALKIVGFTQDIWDNVAQMVCPFWSDFIRAAVQGGTTSTPKPPSHTPPGESTSGSPPIGETLDAWMQFFGDSARIYLDLFADVATRGMAGGYSASDWVADGTRYWSQLAKDWARAWTYGMELVDEVAQEGLNAGFMPPGAAPGAGRGAATSMASAAAATAAPAGTEGTLIPVAGLGETDQPTCSSLVSIEAGSATIESKDISVGVEKLDDGSFGVRLTTTTGSISPGLYVGTIQNPQGQGIAAAQLYISRATDAEQQ